MANFRIASVRQAPTRVVRSKCPALHYNDRKRCWAEVRLGFKMSPFAGAHPLQCIYVDVRILWFRGAGKQSLLPLMRQSLGVR